MIDGEESFLRFGPYGKSSYNFVLSLFSTRMNAFTFMLDFYTYPLFIFMALSIGAWGLRYQACWLGLVLLALGYGIWTFVEYVMHRYAFHHMPGVKPLHMAHHADANDLIGTPSVLSLTLIFLFGYLPAACIFGVYQGCFVFAGLMAGYLAFSAVHFIVHRGEHDRFKLIRKLKRSHAIHHYGNNRFNFGVTTLFWDRVFGTYSDRMR
jgi:sterol desaturase/sphingolipid hydroxylase (fatty acid hydroxylase superfamily)